MPILTTSSGSWRPAARIVLISNVLAGSVCNAYADVQQKTDDIVIRLQGAMGVADPLDGLLMMEAATEIARLRRIKAAAAELPDRAETGHQKFFLQ